MEGKVLLAHGSGGKLSHELVEKLFLPPFDNPILSRLDDAAVLNIWGEGRGARGEGLATRHPSPVTRLAFTTDSYVVKPLFFSGGDIGRLAVCGTVNDLSMVGATPLYISAAFVIEEGFPLEDLERVVTSMQEVAME
ncbi:MAG: AIR synthase related protein, partial [Nitrospinota bacterium]